MRPRGGGLRAGDRADGSAARADSCRLLVTYAGEDARAEKPHGRVDEQGGVKSSYRVRPYDRITRWTHPWWGRAQPANNTTHNLRDDLEERYVPPGFDPNLLLLHVQFLRRNRVVECFPEQGLGIAGVADFGCVADVVKQLKGSQCF